MENKNKFKVGDKVVCIRHVWNFTKGDTYTVKCTGAFKGLIVSDDKGYTRLVDACDFNLAKKSPDASPAKESENNPFETRNELLQAIIDGEQLQMLSWISGDCAWRDISHDDALSMLRGITFPKYHFRINHNPEVTYTIGDTFKSIDIDGDVYYYMLAYVDTNAITTIRMSPKKGWSHGQTKVKDMSAITKDECRSAFGPAFDRMIKVNMEIKEKN